MLELIVPVTTFALASALTPGPNNIMLTASGVNFGYRRTLAHMLGICIGFPAMVIAIGLGLATLFRAVPEFHTALKYAGAAYILWMAWKLARMGEIQGAKARPGKPLTFLQAVLFQWVNPKAWVLSVGAIGAFTTVGGDPYLETLVIALVFAAVCLPTVTLWTLCGVVLRRVLDQPRRLRAFNMTMALLLAASIVPFFVN